MAIVGKVPGKGLTPEAAAALNQETMNDPIDIVSEVPDEDNPFDVPIGEPLFAEADTGDTVEDSRLRQKPQEPPPAREAKPGIPSLDEWMDTDFESNHLVKSIGLTTILAVARAQ